MFIVDGSDGRHVCSKYHGHTHYYQATMLVIVINCLLLSFIVTMAMVMMGGICLCTKFHGHTCTYYYTQLVGFYWRAGASQPSCSTRTIFLYTSKWWILKRSL